MTGPIHVGMLQTMRSIALYGMTTAPLRVKVRMLKAEVIETLLYGCVTWTFGVTNHATLRAMRLDVPRRVLGFQRRADHTNLSSAKAFNKTNCEGIETNNRKRRLFFAGETARRNEGRLPRRMMLPQLVSFGENPGPGGQLKDRHRYLVADLVAFSIHRRPHGTLPIAVWG